MDDKQIVQLYWDRNETAITESSKKYEPYCTAIAYRILSNLSDSQECVNDTWLHAWRAMPPHKPERLSAFLGKITRNLAFDRYRNEHRTKRGGGNMDQALEELAECVSGQEDTEKSWEEKEMIREINHFLQNLPEDKRSMFILRYWYVDSVTDIARQIGTSANYVSVTLSRIRGRLKRHLKERGFDL